MSIETVELLMGIRAVEVLDNAPAALEPPVTHDQFETHVTLPDTVTPVPATEAVYSTIALVDGAKTIDLTSLTGTNGRAVDGTGLKVQAIKLKNTSASNSMTFQGGASNPYELNADANWHVSLPPGGEFMAYCPDTNPDIAADAKTIDVAGTGTDQFELSLVMG